MTHSSIAIQVLPQIGKSDDKEVVRIVDKVIHSIAASGLHYMVGPFETTVEGDFDQLMQIIRRANEICVEEGASKVYCYVKIVYSPNEEILTIDEKTGPYQG